MKQFHIGKFPANVHHLISDAQIQALLASISRDPVTHEPAVPETTTTSTTTTTTRTTTTPKPRLSRLRSTEELLARSRQLIQVRLYFISYISWPAMGGMQAPWPVSELCRYHDQCQRYAGTLTSVRGMQVPWPVSEVCRYPDQCQRYAGILTSVRAM